VTVADAVLNQDESINDSMYREYVYSSKYMIYGELAHNIDENIVYELSPPSSQRELSIGSAT